MSIRILDRLTTPNRGLLDLLGRRATRTLRRHLPLLLLDGDHRHILPFLLDGDQRLILLFLPLPLPLPLHKFLPGHLPLPLRYHPEVLLLAGEDPPPTTTLRHTGGSNLTLVNYLTLAEDIVNTPPNPRVTLFTIKRITKRIRHGEVWR
jgi:hypothetical protein